MRAAVFAIVLAAGCGKAKPKPACATACERIVELSVQGLDQLDPQMAAEVRREMSKATVHDLERCTAKCLERGTDTGCVMRATTIEDAMACGPAAPAP